jgi:hypothetical protein
MLEKRLPMHRYKYKDYSIWDESNGLWTICILDSGHARAMTLPLTRPMGKGP